MLVLQWCDNRLSLNNNHLVKNLVLSGNMSNEELHIVLCGDQSYCIPLSVVMTSIMESNVSDNKITFHILETGFDEYEQKTMDQVADKYGCSINYIPVNKYLNLFERTNVCDFTNKYISIACLFRLLIFKVLPDDVEYCFYIDGDMIVNTDLKPLIEMVGDKLLGAVPESIAMERRNTILSHLKMYKEYSKFIEDPLSYPYFNAGFLVINLKKCRELNIWPEIMSFYNEHPNMPYADQDILNAIFGQNHANDMVYLPPEYNIFCTSEIDYNIGHQNTYFTQEETIFAYANPKIYHYAGYEKPWSNPTCHYNDVWWNCAGKLPCIEELLLFISERLLDKTLHPPYNTNPIYIERKRNISNWILEKMTKDPGVRDRFYRYCNDYNLDNNGGLMKTAFNRLIKFIALTFFNIQKKTPDKSKEITNYYYDLESVKKQIDAHDLISFDVYDTLLSRIFSSPEDVFSYIEQKYEMPGFKEKRIEANIKAYNSKRQSQEVSLELIYSFMPDSMKKARQYEEYVECNCVHPNEPLKKLVNYSKKQNKRVIFTSDMYLDREIIESLLKKCGYSDYELFLSSNIGKTKVTGDLYKFVIDKTGIKPKQMLHIGDNYQYDYVNPGNIGIDCIFIKNNYQSLLDEREPIRIWRDSTRTISTSAICSILATYRGDRTNYWTQFGREFVGPIVLSYVLWLNKMFEYDNKKTILFIARDGFLLNEALKILNPNKYDTHYVYAPRRVSNICNLDFDLKFRNADVQASSFADSILINYLNYDVKKVKELNLKEKEELVYKNLTTIKNKSKAIVDSYHKYICGMTVDNNLAIVDSSTLNFSTQKMMEKILPDANICGYYWVSQFEDINKDEFLERKHRSYVKTHVNHVKDWFLMEFTLTSPELPIIDVVEGKPVYKTANKYDSMRAEVFPLITEGALDFIKRFKELVPNYEMFIIESDIIEKYVNCWIDHPSKEDKQNFMNMKLPVDCEHQSYEQIFKQWYQ